MNKELKYNVMDLLNHFEFTDEELKFLYDVVFYTYTEDYDIIQYLVEEKIQKQNNLEL